MYLTCFLVESLYLQKEAIIEEEQNKNAPGEDGGEEIKEDVVAQVTRDESLAELKEEEEEMKEDKVEAEEDDDEEEDVKEEEEDTEDSVIQHFG